MSKRALNLQRYFKKEQQKGVIMINFIDKEISNQLFMNKYNSDLFYKALKYE